VEAQEALANLGHDLCHVVLGFVVRWLVEVRSPYPKPIPMPEVAFGASPSLSDGVAHMLVVSALAQQDAKRGETYSCWQGVVPLDEMIVVNADPVLLRRCVEVVKMVPPLQEATDERDR